MKHISQIELFTILAKALDKAGWKTLNERQTNGVIAAANILVKELNQESVKSTAKEGLEKWLQSDETGLSSLYIASILSGRSTLRNRIVERNIPHDGSDFGRCLKLLEAVPEWKKRLGEVGKKGGPTWKKLIENWKKLEELYKKERSVEVYEKISEIKKKTESKNYESNLGN